MAETEAALSSPLWHANKLNTAVKVPKISVQYDSTLASPGISARQARNWGKITQKVTYKNIMKFWSDLRN